MTQEEDFNGTDQDPDSGDGSRVGPISEWGFAAENANTKHTARGLGAVPSINDQAVDRVSSRQGGRRLKGSNSNSSSTHLPAAGVVSNRTKVTRLHIYVRALTIIWTSNNYIFKSLKEENN